MTQPSSSHPFVSLPPRPSGWDVAQTVATEKLEEVKTGPGLRAVQQACLKAKERAAQGDNSIRGDEWMLVLPCISLVSLVARLGVGRGGREKEGKGEGSERTKLTSTSSFPPFPPPSLQSHTKPHPSSHLSNLQPSSLRRRTRQADG